jgi:DNA replication protein DnaC
LYGGGPTSFSSPRIAFAGGYANPDLSIVDEFGFDKIERAECPEAGHLLYKIVASRNRKRSTAPVTNLDFDKWGD